jgi:hypothetical protein
MNDSHWKCFFNNISTKEFFMAHLFVNISSNKGVFYLNYILINIYTVTDFCKTIDIDDDFFTNSTIDYAK